MPSTAFCDDFSGQASKWSYSALSGDGSQWVDQKYRQVSEFAMEKLMLLGRTTISGRVPGYPELFLKTPLHPTLTPKAEAGLTPTVRAEPGAQAQSAHIGTQHVLSEGQTFGKCVFSFLKIKFDACFSAFLLNTVIECNELESRSLIVSVHST